MIAFYARDERERKIDLNRAHNTKLTDEELLSECLHRRPTFKVTRTITGVAAHWTGHALQCHPRFVRQLYLACLDLMFAEDLA